MADWIKCLMKRLNYCYVCVDVFVFVWCTVKCMCCLCLCGVPLNEYDRKKLAHLDDLTKYV